MTHRVTLDVPVSGTRYGIPYVTSDEANATVVDNDNGFSQTYWSGVQVEHAPEPGTSGTASIQVKRQSDNVLIAQTVTTGSIYLYYPNSSEYSNANLQVNQGTCEWDTYYYMEVSPNVPSERRERIALKKLTTTIKSNT